MNTWPATPSVKDMQWHVRCYCDQRDHKWVTPNAILYSWESDLISVTRSRLVHEFEVKRSRADLLRDVEKPKHKEGQLLSGQRPPRALQVLDRTYRTPGATIPRPNYFWYVVPEALMDIAQSERMPAYAGVIVIGNAGERNARRYDLAVLREAERLHLDPITDSMLLQLAEKMHYRYWGMMRAEQNKALKKRVEKMYAEERTT